MQPMFWILGVLNLANGLWMLFAPESWYHGLPAAVPDTGPFNAHFVRDIGAAFATIGVALCVAARVAAARRGVVWAVTGFLGLHAAVHVADLFSGRLHGDHWAIDLPGVFLPALFFAVLCLPRWWRRAEGM
ncbi:MAG TPA: hypothetical protein VL403_11475 [Candidatus Kryptonia bacterium]|nr:hypothetical protein [Candidatus Kryptonia bacterium]